MGVLEVVNLGLFGVLAAAALGVVAIGWYQRLDPRVAASWVEDAERALARGHPKDALRLARRAMSFPRTGRYSAEQARITAAALDVAERALRASGAHLPPPAWSIRHRLGRGQRAVGRLAEAARDALDGLAA